MKNILTTTTTTEIRNRTRGDFKATETIEIYSALDGLKAGQYFEKKHIDGFLAKETISHFVKNIENIPNFNEKNNFTHFTESTTSFAVCVSGCCYYDYEIKPNLVDLNVANALLTAKDLLSAMMANGIADPKTCLLASNALQQKFNLSQDDAIVVLNNALKLI